MSYFFVCWAVLHPEARAFQWRGKISQESTPLQQMQRSLADVKGLADEIEVMAAPAVSLMPALPCGITGRKRSRVSQLVAQTLEF